MDVLYWTVTVSPVWTCGVTVTENDGVIGNEVTNATDGTLVRSGAGTTVSPYTLDVSADGITNSELADNAVQLENIADGAAADQIMQWDGANWVLVDGSALSTDDQQLDDPSTVFNAGTNELTIALEDGGTATADLSALDNAGTDDQALSLAVNTLTLEDGGTVDLSPYLDDTDDQTLSIVGDQLSIADGNTITVPTADGSETIVNGAGINVVTGTGTSGDPYVVTGTEVDGDITNEINTGFAVNAGNLDITDSDGTLSVPLSSLGTDDQVASEVNSDVPVDVDGDGNTEATVEDVIQDIAPITAKAARIFYPPSIAVDASTNGVGYTENLYTQYIAQFGTPTVASAGAPAAVPTYAATDLYYYVTYADPAVFANMSIDASGVLTYDIVGQPSDYNSLINVVFVVK